MHQLYCSEVDIQVLWDMLDTVCDLNKNTYVFSIESYKKGQTLSGEWIPFIETLFPHYYKSKRFYLTRKMSYKTLLTIIRQLCNYKNVLYTQNVSYVKSKYTISYTIYRSDSLK